MLGDYKVKHPGLQPLHAKARLLAHEIGRVTFEHVGRALNAHADRLANQAMDAPLGGIGKADAETLTVRAPPDGGHWYTRQSLSIHLQGGLVG